MQGIEDFAFVEFTPSYRIEQLQEAFQSTLYVVWIKDGPQLLGWPHKRMRLLGALLNRQTVQ